MCNCSALPLLPRHASPRELRRDQEPPGIKPQARHDGFLARGPVTHPPTSWPINELRSSSSCRQVASMMLPTLAKSPHTARGCARDCGVTRPRRRTSNGPRRPRTRARSRRRKRRRRRRRRSAPRRSRAGPRSARRKRPSSTRATTSGAAARRAARRARARARARDLPVSTQYTLRFPNPGPGPHPPTSA